MLLCAHFLDVEKTKNDMNPENPNTHPFGRVMKDLARRCMRYRQAMTALQF